GPTWYDAYQKPDVVAPGHKLIADAATKSWLYQEYPGSLVVESAGSHAQFITLSGTSMATAVTSGVVALVIEANRQAVLQTAHSGHLTPNAIKAVLEYTASVLPNTDVLTQGAGAINPLGATDLAAHLDPAAGIDSPWLIAAVTPSTTTPDG